MANDKDQKELLKSVQNLLKSDEARTAQLDRQTQLLAEQEAYLKKQGATRDELRGIEIELNNLHMEELQILSDSKNITAEKRLELLREIDALKAVNSELETQASHVESIRGKIDTLTTSWKTGFTGSIITSFKNLDAIGKKLKENLTFKNIAGTLSEKMIQSTMLAVAQVGSLTAEMAKNTGQGAALNGVMNDVASSSRSFGVGFTESAKAVTALSTGMSGFISMNSNTQAELATTVARLESFGVAAETTASNLDTARQVMGLTNVEAIQMQKDMAALAAGIGMPAGKLAESFKAAAPQLASYGSNMVGVFNELAKTSKKTGIEINDLLGITQQFDTFEGAANAAGKLNSILGGGLLNSTELLMANESERLDMIRDSIAASGQSFDSMGRFQQMAIANAAGIKDMAQAQRLFSEQARAQQEEINGQAVSQEELEKRQKASVSIQQKMTQVMQMFAVAVMPIVNILHGFMNIILSINDSLGGFLLPTLIGVVAAMYLLRAATAVAASIKATYLGLTSAGIGLKAKKMVMDKIETAQIYGLYAAENLRNLSQKRGIVGTLAYMAIKAKEAIVSRISAAATFFGIGATNAEIVAKNRSRLATIAGAAVEKGWAALKYGIALATNAISTALGIQSTAAAASVPANAAAAGGEAALGTAAYFAVIPVGLLALALGLLAVAAAVVIVSVLEFVKFLIEAPVRILYAVAAFAVLAVGLSLVSIAMQFVGVSAVVMGTGLLVMLGQFNAMIPLIPGFLFAIKFLSIGVLALAFAFGILALSMGGIAVSMVAIATSMASIVKSTVQMATGSGILAFRSSLSEMVDDLGNLEDALSVLVAFSSVSMTMAASLNMVASSLIVMSFGLSIVSVQLSNMAESMKSMEGVNASFESVMTTATTITPETVANVEGLVNQAERYTESQIGLKAIGNLFGTALDNLVGAVTGGDAGAGEGKNSEIVLVLNDREFARAVSGVMDKKMKLNLA